MLVALCRASLLFLFVFDVLLLRHRNTSARVTPYCRQLRTMLLLRRIMITSLNRSVVHITTCLFTCLFASLPIFLSTYPQLCLARNQHDKDRTLKAHLQQPDPLYDNPTLFFSSPLLLLARTYFPPELCLQALRSCSAF